MCGANAIQAVSALLRHGAGRLRTILDGIREWVVASEHESFEHMRGNMSLDRCPDPRDYERGNCVKTLLSWCGEF
jgi:dihydroorotate dehydrogenase (fumarate)